MRKVVLAVLGGSCALLGSRYLSRRAAIAAVPAELRSPFMFLPFPSTARMLPLTRQISRLSMPPGPGVTVTRHRIDGIPVQVTTPAVGGSRRPAVLWIHGGGTVLGSPQFESRPIGRLARELNAVVVSPDYRLAPEHPFPAPLDDCMATLRWMRDSADELGIDADRIAVAGASAGGGKASVRPLSTITAVNLGAEFFGVEGLDRRAVRRAVITFASGEDIAIDVRDWAGVGDQADEFIDHVLNAIVKPQSS
jgi:hypothetical protein